MKALIFAIMMAGLTAQAQTKAPYYIPVDANGNSFLSGTGVAAPVTQAPSFTCVTNVLGTLQYCASGGGGGGGSWSALTNPTTNLALTMGANKTSFANTPNFTPGSSFTGPWQFNGNGINFSADWINLYNGTQSSQPTDEMDVGINVPNTSSSLQSTALAAWASCAQPTGNLYCVALYGQAIRKAAGSYVHGFNANASDNNLGSGYTLFAGELNSQVHNVTSGGASLLISANIDNANTPYDAIDINAPGLNPYYSDLALLNGSASIGIAVGTAKGGATSMPVIMNSATGNGSYQMDASGNFNFTNPVVSPGAGVTDNFQRAAGGLGANWTGSSTIQIVSSGVVGSTSGTGNAFDWYTGAGAFNTNQCSSIVIQAVGTPTTTWSGALVNATDANNMYGMISFNISGAVPQYQVFKLVGGVATTIIAQRAFAEGGVMFVGDQFKLCRYGNTLTAYRNGIADQSVTDSSLSGGFPGIGFPANTDPRISSFTGMGLNTPFPLQSVGSAIASASTIAPTAGITHITGTAAIATITPPTGMSTNIGGCLTFIADAAWTTTTAGNIHATMTASSGTPYQACYDGAVWFIK